MFDIRVIEGALSQELLEILIEDFYSGVDKILPGRKFKLNTDRARELLLPIIRNYLPGQWVVDGGNYFETEVPYRLHCDSGKDTVKKLYYNIVIPLKLWGSPVNVDLNKLIVTDQRWGGDAAFFVKGDPDATNEYNTCVRDYSDIGGTGEEIDQKLLELCTHLNPQNLVGFTIKECITWTPGDIILFKRDLIHTTSNWRAAGVTKKLGLSLFTSYR